MSFDQFLGQVLGPLGALVGAVATVIVLWREHVKSDAREQARLDRALTIVEGVVPALQQLSAAQEAANRDAAERHRREDR